MIYRWDFGSIRPAFIVHPRSFHITLRLVMRLEDCPISRTSPTDLGSFTLRFASYFCQFIDQIHCFGNSTRCL